MLKHGYDSYKHRSLSLSRLLFGSDLRVVIAAAIAFLILQFARTHEAENRKTVARALRDRINDCREGSRYIYHIEFTAALRHFVGYYPISFDKFQNRFSNVSLADKAAWQTRR